MLGATAANAAAPTTASEPGSGYAPQDENDEFPWGLLGLLGLAGLLGMKREDRRSVREEGASRPR